MCYWSCSFVQVLSSRGNDASCLFYVPLPTCQFESVTVLWHDSVKQNVRVLTSCMLKRLTLLFVLWMQEGICRL